MLARHLASLVTSRAASRTTWSQSRSLLRSTPFINSSRTFASSPAAVPPSKATNAKPNKSTTALKRTASASLPIRSNPTPTRSSIRPVFTFSTAERYDLRALRKVIPASVEFQESLWVPISSYQGQPCELWIFGNGSLVCWGGDEGAARAFVKQVFEKDPAIQVGRLDHAETEELEFVTDPAEKTRLQGDLIILGQMPELSELRNPEPGPESETPSLPLENAAARYAFSHALARSTSLAALESSLDHYLQSVSNLPHSLAKTGKPGLERKELIMKLGELLKLRQTLNLTQESFGDTPDFYWSEPVLEEYFNSVSKALEIRIRTKSVNDKITYAAELQSTLRELLTESTGHRMELIIIALIAVEVVLAFIRDGPELWEAAFGKEEHPPKQETELSA